MATRKNKPVEKIINEEKLPITREEALQLHSYLSTMQNFKWLGSVLGSQPLTAIVGLLAAGSIIACVAYALGYIFTVDFRLISLFSLQDVIAIGLPAVPIITLLTLFASVMMLCVPDDKFKRKTEAMTLEPHLNLSQRKKSRLHYYRTRYGFTMFTIIFVGWGFFFGPRPLAIFIGIVFGLLIVFDMMMRRSRPFPAGVSLALAALMVILLPFALMGATNAERDLGSSRRNYHLVVHGKSHDVLLMAANADILLVRDDPRTVRVIPRSMVTDITVFNVGEVRPLFSLSRIWKKLFSTETEINTHGR